MRTLDKVGTSRGEPTAQMGEEAAKSKCLAVTGRIEGILPRSEKVLTCCRCFTAKKGGISVNVHHSTTLLSEKCTDRALAHQWNSIDWNATRATVNRLQTRIAKAVIEGKWNLVKRLQHLLTHSYHAKLLSVRIVTQNRGKRTAGIDGELWNTPHAKMQAAMNLTDRQYHTQPLKRIYIPKPGKMTKRPLSIPTMRDRAMQALYALALQPIAETLADFRSFGFRLYRSAQDASQYAYQCLTHPNAAPWVLEGDIRGCFDNISHEWLMKNIPIDKKILHEFMKAGFLYEQQLFPTNRGTPQGGVISPLLANMVLDGMETLIMDQYPNMKVHFIRYADDFIVTAPTQEIAQELKELIRRFLQERGLELSEEKTAITHINDGFDFLGWNIRKYRGILLMKPSKASVQKLTQKIRDIVQKASAWTQDQLIDTLNPITIGWTNYHRHVASKATFKRMDAVIWNMLWRWAKRRHPKKGHQWIANRYWYTVGTRNWVFKSDTRKLTLFADTRIKRHPQVKLEMNPYLDREYFLNRIDSLKRRQLTTQTKLTYFAICRPKFGL